VNLGLDTQLVKGCAHIAENPVAARFAFGFAQDIDAHG
jgi:hypothetical protein